MYKENVVHTHTGILLSHKKNEILIFGIMKLENIMLSEISQVQKRQILHILTHVETKRLMS
jgi:hypothetical protein